MFRLHSALVCSDQPQLQVLGHSPQRWQRVGVVLGDSLSSRISRPRGLVATAAGVRPDRAAKCDVVTNELGQRLRLGGSDDAHPAAARSCVTVRTGSRIKRHVCVAAGQVEQAAPALYHLYRHNAYQMICQLNYDFNSCLRRPYLVYKPDQENISRLGRRIASPDGGLMTLGACQIRRHFDCAASFLHRLWLPEIAHRMTGNPSIMYSVNCQLP